MVHDCFDLKINWEYSSSWNLWIFFVAEISHVKYILLCHVRKRLIMELIFLMYISKDNLCFTHTKCKNKVNGSFTLARLNHLTDYYDICTYVVRGIEKDIMYLLFRRNAWVRNIGRSLARLIHKDNSIRQSSTYI